MSVNVLNNHNFDNEISSSGKPVLVDFWASWCGPCKMFSPIVDEFAQQHDEISVAKVNIDDEPDIASKFKVMSVPTLLLFKNGEVEKKSVGFKSLKELEQFISS